MSKNRKGTKESVGALSLADAENETSGNGPVETAKAI